MRRDHVQVEAPGPGGSGDLIAYGHHGRPLLVFPSEQGVAWDYENNGMIGALAPLIDEGRLKVYCVGSFDSASWVRDDLELEDRALLHGFYEGWITDNVVTWIHDDCRGALDILTTGCSFGAYHAANLALKRADLFPVAICQSGVYDVSKVGWGRRGDSLYFNNPMDYVAHLSGDDLKWLQGRVSLVLTCGRGRWEGTTGALESTKAFAAVLDSKGIRVELDLWGHDVPHDWPSWRNQIAHHMPRFC